MEKDVQSYLAYEAEGDALARFQSKSPDQKLESMYLGSLAMIRRLDDITEHLRVLNGSVAETKEELGMHLAEQTKEAHEVAFIKRWGARGTAGLMALISVAAALVATMERIWK